jgi:hypothetical protein
MVKGRFKRWKKWMVKGRVFQVQAVEEMDGMRNGVSGLGG